ncbi:MAG: lysylphosphatidylglycerol synthase transmembrane domain-containing protein [Methanocellales archaeon]|nr:lysylphosphatidylglycerol synthase transmembrane domain-containing protein [Methanocellales archaeon]
MKNQIKGVILSLIGLGILLYLIWKMNISLSIIYSIKYIQFILVAILLILILRFIAALRMKHLLLSTNKKNVPFRKIVMIEFISKFLFYTTPFKLNVPAKAILLNKTCDVKPSDGASVVTFEYALDTSIALFIGIFGVFLFFKNISLAKITYVILFVGICTLVFLSTPAGIFDKLRRKSEHIRNPILRRTTTFIFNLMKTVRETWITIIFNKQMYYVLPITALFWIVGALFTKSLFLSADYYIPLTWIIVVECVAAITGGVSNIPGGLGVSEATMVLLYTALGISREVSVAVVLLYRLLTIAPIIVGYVFSLHVGLRDFIKTK